MKNRIIIDPENYIGNIIAENGDDQIVVEYWPNTASENLIDLYIGDEFIERAQTTTTSTAITYTIPSEYLTGSNIHFRLVPDGVPEQFYHICYDPEQQFAFRRYNLVVCGNKYDGGIPAEMQAYEGDEPEPDPPTPPEPTVETQDISELPVGTLVVDPDTKYNDEPIIWHVLEHGHEGDPEGATALESSEIITLKAFDAAEPLSSNRRRQYCGNNRYLYSNLLQWLNSDAAAGEWYSAQHNADTAPIAANLDNGNAYAQEAGFLAGFSNGFKSALQTASKETIIPSVDGGGTENVESKVFLLSIAELNWESNGEGSVYDYYANASSAGPRRLKKPTAEAVEKSDYTNSDLTPEKYWSYWTRTAYRTDSEYLYCMNENGGYYAGMALNGRWGVAPALVISQDAKVTKEPNESGQYELVFDS